MKANRVPCGFGIGCAKDPSVTANVLYKQAVPSLHLTVSSFNAALHQPKLAS